jgi:hypothetical protein
MMALLYYVLKVAFGDEYKAPKDIIVWEFPPIISKDIVKIMTAWSTLITQVAKDNTVVRKIAIRGAISDMGVAGVDQLMKEIEAEEKRLEAQKAEQRQMQMDQMQNPEKTPIAGFAKANAAGGGNPDIARAQRGKPPVNREGRKSNIAGS